MDVFSAELHSDNRLGAVSPYGLEDDVRQPSGWRSSMVGHKKLLDAFSAELHSDSRLGAMSPYGLED